MTDAAERRAPREGTVWSFTRTFTHEDVEAFTDLSGDAGDHHVDRTRRAVSSSMGYWWRRCRPNSALSSTSSPG